MFDLTANEIKVMLSLKNNHFGEGDCTWSWAVNDSDTPSGITGKALSGVISSLVKKGLLTTSNDGTRDATIDTTTLGREWMKGE